MESLITMTRWTNRRGVTAVEVLIVVAIVSLVAAITLPRMLRARHDANEFAAIESIKEVSAALERYRAAQRPSSYPESLADLANGPQLFVNPSLVSATTTDTARNGYYFTYQKINENQFTLLSSPVKAGATGSRVFFVNESGRIHLDSIQGALIE